MEEDILHTIHQLSCFVTHTNTVFSRIFKLYFLSYFWLFAMDFKILTNLKKILTRIF